MPRITKAQLEDRIEELESRLEDKVQHNARLLRDNQALKKQHDGDLKIISDLQNTANQAVLSQQAMAESYATHEATQKELERARKNCEAADTVIRKRDEQIRELKTNPPRSAKADTEFATLQHAYRQRVQDCTDLTSELNVYKDRATEHRNVVRQLESEKAELFELHAEAEKKARRWFSERSTLMRVLALITRGTQA